MDNDKLRQELFYMVKLTAKYDFTRQEVVEEILRLENERQILTSVFGKRFKERIFDIAYGQTHDGTCVICGKQALNGVICDNCMESISDSAYAKSKESPQKAVTSNTKDLKSNVWSVVSKILVILLSLLMIIQIVFLCLWYSTPTRNPRTKAIVSQNAITPIDSQEEAYTQLELDFPESEGYTITFARTDTEYVGRFLIDVGESCDEVEADLTDEERYDYFLKEDVYVFYISYLDDISSKIGMAEINADGHIIVMGQFNDGRKTDTFYRYR